MVKVASKGKATGNRCGLTLRINGVAYRVRPVEARDRDFGVVRAFSLARAGADPIIVADTLHGTVCECADFTFRRDGIDPKGCKHLRAARAVGLF